MDTKKPVAKALKRNIEVLEKLQRAADSRRGTQVKIADFLTAWSGSMAFFYFHAAWFAAWALVNTGRVPAIAPFDPFPFGLLTMVVSLEAIFLANIVLISQNREAKLNSHKAALDLQIDLLGEYEVTQCLRLLRQVAAKLDVTIDDHADLNDLCEDVTPELVMLEIERREQKA
jgi:uncharacterized membrane protein